ncbi:MAG: hypothetical protein ABIP71_05470, partial [Verrucomicrobiota bacterium]
ALTAGVGLTMGRATLMGAGFVTFSIAMGAAGAIGVETTLGCTMGLTNFGALTGAAEIESLSPLWPKISFTSDDTSTCF